MTTINIWNKFKFNDEKQKSALDCLNEFKEGLVIQTSGELRLDIETVDSYVETDKTKLAVIYKLFVVAPRLGNFRRKILSVIENSDSGRFPVDIINHYSEEKILDIQENEFIQKIENILSSPSVKNSIENLYQLSKENNK